MFLRKHFDKHTGVYRSSDSIENFKIRVSLRTLNTLIKVPKFVHHTEVNTSTEVNETDEIESHTIRWQEKRLSRKEIKFFSDKENCQTDAQKEYHQMIKRHSLVDEDRHADKIFTYVSEDSFNPDGDDKKFIELVQQLNDSDEESETGDLLISSTNAKEKLFKGIFGFDTMYVMADLGPETILFSIRWRRRDGLLIVYPDFNSISVDPYLQEIDSGRRHMFHFAMENVSKDYDHDGNHTQKDIQVISHLTRNLSITTSSSFQIPPNRCTNVLFFMEIESGEYFEYDNIHARYSITVPHCCHLVDGLTEGSTHSSRKGYMEDRQNIGYCYESMILCSNDYQWNDNLKIALEVISIDGWNKERSEGYCYLIIPLKPGIFQHKLPCYRELTGNTYLDKLKRYFIGGRRIVDQKTFNGISSTEKLSKLNRYGNETKSTGFLYVKHQMILQRSESFASTNNTRKSTAKNPSKHLTTIEDVVSAYQLAKHRLQATTAIETSN